MFIKSVNTPIRFKNCVKSYPERKNVGIVVDRYPTQQGAFVDVAVSKDLAEANNFIQKVDYHYPDFIGGDIHEMVVVSMPEYQVEIILA